MGGGILRIPRRERLALSTREIELAIPLLSEVVDWVESGALFSHDYLADIPAYSFEDGTIPLQVASVTEWHTAIDVNNEDSMFLTMIELSNEIEGAYRLIHQFGPSTFADFVTDETEKIRKAIIVNDGVERMARLLWQSNLRRKGTADQTIDHLCLTIHNHFATIVYARAASLSTRHAPSEALFHAYRLGLLPFGWDWESLWCLRPIHDAPMSS